MINIQKELRAGLSAPGKTRRPRKLGVFYPTEANTCKRRLFYKLIGTAPDDEASGLPYGLFKMGCAAEDAVVDGLIEALKPRGIEVDSQRRAFYNDGCVEIHGYADFVLTYPDGHEFVGEIKSTVSKYKMSMKIPDFGYQGQLQCYLNIFEIEDGCILYVNRGDILINNQVNQKRDPGMFERIMCDFGEVLDAVIDDEPPASYEKFEDECKYCDYKATCGMSPTKSKYEGIFQRKLERMRR